MAFNIPLICSRSGLRIGNFIPNTGLYGKTSAEGMSPYVKGWKETTFMHPIFSISLSALYHRAESMYLLEKRGKQQYPALQKQLMFLALLHASDCIIQTVPCLPSEKTANSYFPNLLELIARKKDSTRLQLPKLHIWYGAAGEMAKDPFSQISVWLSACTEVMEEYEHTIRTRQKVAKQQAAALALKNIKRNLYEDLSIRKLWSWVSTQIPEFEQNQWPEMRDLFFASEKNISVWTIGEMEDLENILLTYCETGNSVSHEVFKRMNQLKTWLTIYNDTFEILIEDFHPELRGTPAPEPKNFQNRSSYLIAEAKWKLANKEKGETVVAAPKKRSSKITSEDL